MRRAILHIGFYKTGTTSIQQVLFAGRGILLKYGFYYPRQGISGGYGHNNIPRELNGNPLFDPQFGSLAQLVAEIKELE